MSSKKVFNAMESRDWNKVKELIATTSWTPKELNKKHGMWEDTLLIRAAQEGKADVVSLLLNTTEVTNQYGAAALYCAARNGHLLTVDILLNRGANTEIRDKSGFTPLMGAARRGHSEVVTLLIDRGANINAQNDDGATALYCAVEEGELKAVEILLDRGADIEIRERQLGWTPLIEVVKYGHSDMMALLVERGANINAQDNEGVSALIGSASEGRVAMVKLLCGKTVTDLNVKDNDGHDALYYAEQLLRTSIDSGSREDAEEIIAVLLEEAEWRRVKNFVAFLHTGGFSAVDWSVRRLGGSGFMSTTDGTTAAVTPFTLRGNKSKVLENRDLCRIVVSYIPKQLSSSCCRG